MRLPLSAAVLLLVLSLPAAPALACGNSMSEEEEAHARARLVARRLQLLKVAEEHLAAGKFDSAERLARRVFLDAYGRTSRQARVVLGVALLRQGSAAEARSHLEAALQAEPSALISSRLAEAELALGMVDRAWTRLEPLVAMNYLDADGYVALARAQVARGHRPEALEAVRSALKSAPHNPRALALERELAPPLNGA